MKTYSALSIAAVATAVNLPTTLAWWDNGHMLGGQVATQLMDKADVATIEQLLSKWDADFPGTSTITTASIWADQIKCSSVSPFCASPSSPSIGLMEKWHYIDLPLNVNGAKWGGKDASLDLFKESLDGDLTEVLEKSLVTLQTTKSVWAANLVIRNFIHAMTDLHQPLHAVGGVSADNPGGDAGGNFYKFAPPCAFSNLHALWDSGAGLYSQNNWASNMDAIKVELQKNATALLQWLPHIEDKLNFDQYKNLSYSKFVTRMGAKESGIKQLVLESYAYAEHSVYPGLDLTYLNVAKQQVACPSPSYVDWAKVAAQLRIVTAGKNLAVFLTQFAKQLRVLGLAK